MSDIRNQRFNQRDILRVQFNHLTSAGIAIVVPGFLLRAPEQLLAIGEQAGKYCLVRLNLLRIAVQMPDRRNISLDLVFCQLIAHGIQRSIMELMCLVNNYEIAVNEQGMLFFIAHSCGGEEQLMVGYLKIKLTEAVALCHFAIEAFIFISASGASLHADAAFHGFPHFDGIQVKGSVCKAASIEGFHQSAVLFGVQLDFVIEIIEAAFAEVMLLALAECYGQRLGDGVAFHEDF